MKTVLTLLCIIMLAAANDALGHSAYRASNTVSVSKITPVHDPVVPGVVIVKLTRDGAAQMATNNNLLKMVASENAVYKFQHAEQAFPEHSIMRYAGGAATMAIQNPQADDGVSRILFIHYASGASPEEVSAALSHNPFVEYAEPQYIRKIFSGPLSFTPPPNDSLYPQQWNLAKIQAPLAWTIEQGDTNVIIAIVDNGVDTSHPDIQANIWHNQGEEGLDAQGRDKRTNGIDDDGDGYIDDWQGWDFAGATQGAPQDNDPSGVQNGLAHGIHVAGIAAAVTNNHIGVAGVAPNCRLMLVKAAYDDQADNIQFGFEGIMYAVDHGARIINCSWGGESPSSSEQDVINYAASKGALIVAAAGNNDNSLPLYPASYNHVLSVTASDKTDSPDIFFSNFGPTVDVLAPGTSILSTYYGNSYGTLDGTSMASPCAAGVAALVASHFPSYTADQIAARVRATSDPIDNLLDYKYQKLFGFGRVNAYRAVHDANVKAVVIDSFYVSNDSNHDGVLEPGETGAIRVRFKNLLSPTVQLTATLVDSISGGTPDNIQSGIDPYVTVTNPNDYVGAMQTFGTATTPGNVFTVQVSPNVPQNYLLHLRVDFADGAYHDYRYFTLFINPTFVTMDKNDIACTFNSRGNEAFNDFPTNSQGIGFTYKNGENLLFEGALILATDAVHVVNVARDNPSAGQDADFLMTQRATLSNDAASGTQEATASWNDSNADTSRRLGVSVSMHNYEYTTPGNTNFVIVTYTIQNTSNKILSNLFCGTYLDWDIGQSGDSNFVTYDDPYKLGWMARVNSTAYPLCGSALLSSQAPSFYALDNDPNSSNPPFTVNSGFTFAEKYTCLSSGIGRRSSSIGDVSNTIGGGPVTLAPGQKDTFAFALLAGNTLASLEQGVIAARQLWQAISSNQNPHTNVFFQSTNLYAGRDTVLINAADNTSPGLATATLSIAGANSADFSILSPTTLHLNAGEKQNVDIRFTPTDTGLESALLLINYQSYTDTINLYGTGLPIGLSYQPQELSYGSIAINQASSKYATIASSRNDTVYAALSISGRDSSEFFAAIPSPIMIPPGGVTFPVEFQPLQIDTSVATLIIKPTIGLPDTVLLTGVGYIANGSTVAAYPSPLIFDTTTVGASRDSSFTIYNSNASPVQIAFRIIGQDSASFDAVGLNSPMMLQPGKTAISIMFTASYARLEENTAAFQFYIIGGSDTLAEPLQGFANPQTGVHEPGAAQSVGLIHNYPNPFSVQTAISFAGIDGVKSIVVYDMLGREVADLSSQLTWGNLSQQVVFDGSQLPQGVYFYKVGLPGKVLSGQMTLLK